ncbi:DUF2171 domain-containing protein [Sphingomonas bacterium]|uniref:DUF2171 domain-containing protein n=1 Tax=Sphingomonas bacterium TaxID=1895847 RepID=UPI0020C61C45|nr:DUF2171 domain-containing protein [Sphingomonas bacterium]
MVQASEIRKDMDVVGSDGGHVGTIDHVDGDRIKLQRRDAPDGEHHYLPFSSIARVDTRVHLTIAAAAALALGVGTAATGAHEGPLPPVQNRAVGGSAPRGNFYLPWIVGIIGVILLLLLLRSCFQHKEEAAPVATAPAVTPLPVEAVKLPDGTSVNLAPQTLNYELQRYLASNEAAPRTFTFDKLNFDTGSAAIRAEDQPTIDALAQILAAYPKAKVRIVGYTDAKGTEPANATLGQQRAEAVVAALGAKTIAKDRTEAASGGESNPADTNATPQGRFDNRRTELVVLEK